MKMEIVGADPRERARVRDALDAVPVSPGEEGAALGLSSSGIAEAALAWPEGITIVLARSREDWALLNAVEGAAVVVAYDRRYADEDGDGGAVPTFHIDDIAALRSYLRGVSARLYAAAARESYDYDGCLW